MARLLIVSEALPNPNKGGASQTLFNVFKSFKDDEVMYYTFAGSGKNTHLVKTFVSNVLFCKRRLAFRVPEKLPLSALFNFALSRLEGVLTSWSPLQHEAKLKKFRPDVILFCPLSLVVVEAHDKLKELFRVPSIMYFMDDWPVGKEKVMDLKIKDVLDKSQGHIFISEYLKSSMQVRLGFKEKPFLLVHNPVDKESICYQNIEIKNQGTFRIMYAGSLWAIQLDAVKQMAQAVHILRERGIDILFTLYTQAGFYEQYKEFWEENEVDYGGWLTYAELREYLTKADLLVVAASFLEEYKNLTLGSLQTKVTDYLSACRPVLCLGPSYSANNLFVKTHHCGLTFESSSPSALGDYLETLIPQRHNYSDMIGKGVSLLEQELNTELIHQKVSAFLEKLKTSNESKN